MQKDERDQLEKKLAHKAAWRGLDPEDFKDWKDCGFTIKYRGHSGKTFVVWQCTGAEPKILDVYKVSDFNACLQDGLWANLADDKSNEQLVDHTPARLGGYDIFVHIPFIQDMQYLPNHNETANVLRFPLIFKQTGRPRSLVVNSVYLTDVVDLVSIFPQFTDRKF